ncbi:nucleic-acid-binding protein [Cellulomonas sp. Leaf395]|nr:nucleic-acid-binding protein [Cellulomonas sp. Leaf395]
MVAVQESAGGSPAVLLVDVGRRMPGRGAWLHPDPGCLEKAERRRAFGRALRVAGQPGTSAVHRHLEEQQEQDVVG